MPKIKTPILGGAYTARSVNAAQNRMVNLYSEVIPEGGKEAGVLIKCPGTRLVATVGIGPIRGFWRLDNIIYVVSANKFYKVDALWNVTLLGTVDNTQELVSMSDNGFQIFIACNPRGFIYNIN